MEKEMDIQRIYRIKQLRKHVEEIKAEREVLTVSQMDDLSEIPMLYNLFEKSVRKLSWKKSNKDCLFIFIIAYLYSPEVFMKKKLKRGIRKILAEVLRLNNEVSVSEKLSESISWFGTYKDFQNKVCMIYGEMMEEYKKKS